MELNKALDILQERMDTNKVILNDKSYESDFDKFVRVENEAIGTILDYFKNTELLIDISEENLCPICKKPLNFKWENWHGERKIANCCNKEYWIIPSNIYKLEQIKDIEGVD